LAHFFVFKEKENDTQPMVDSDYSFSRFSHLETCGSVFDVPLVCQNRKNTKNENKLLFSVSFIWAARISVCGILTRLASAFLSSQNMDGDKL